MFLTNISTGPRGFYTDDGEFIELEPGEISGDVTLTDYPAEWFTEGAPIDRDGDGSPGGSLPYGPPALSNKTKAQLIVIAGQECVVIDDDMTVVDLKAAIELAREG